MSYNIPCHTPRALYTALNIMWTRVRRIERLCGRRLGAFFERTLKIAIERALLAIRRRKKLWLRTRDGLGSALRVLQGPAENETACRDR